MKIAEFSVKNWQFTVIIFVMVLAIGVRSLLNMPRGEDPNFTAPSYAVIVIYPGTGPTDMEELVVDPIEEVVNEMDNVKRIISSTDDGLAVVRIDFTYDSDPDEKYNDLLREVNKIRDDLPADILDIRFQKFRPSDVNILQVGLVAEDVPYRELEDWADKLKERLEKIKNLRTVETHAHPRRRVRVSLDLGKMAQHGIGLNRVLGAIQSENVNIPGGSIEVGSKKFNVKTSGDYASTEEIENTVVVANGGQNVYVRDIAEIAFNYEEETYLGRLNGQRAVFVTASQKDNKNIDQTRDQLYPVLAAFEKELPAGIRYEKSFDQAESVSRRLSGFSRDFAIAIVLVLLTLIPLGWRASLVVMITIPLCLAMGLAMLDFLGFNINQLSIVGLVVALGLLVDDAIVVVENIERFIRNGYSRKEAAIQATGQIGRAVLGCTAVLIFAFLPLVFLPEGSGDFIRSLPMAVITTVLASLFVALTIVPFLASQILREGHPEGNFFLRGLKRILNRTYKPILDKALHYPKTTLAIAGLIFLGSLALIPVVGSSLFPKSDKPMFLIQIETPLGTSLYETNRVARYVEKELAKYPQIRNYATNVGKGNPRIYYNIIPRNETPSFAELFVQTNPDLHLEDTEALVNDLRRKFNEYPNAKIQVKQFEQGPAQEAPIAIRVFGENLDSLRSLSFKVEKIIQSTPGTLYVDNPLTTLNTDVKVEINKDKAGLLGIAIADIDRTVRMGITGINAGTFREADGDEFPINVSLPRGNRQTLEAFDHMYVSAASGALVPLSQLATVGLQTSPTSIRHYDQDRFVSITANVRSGYLTSAVTSEVLKKLAAFPFPKGYSYVPAGEVESSQESFGGLGTIVIVTVFSILAILILEFGTFRSTLIVLSVIPLGVIGGVLILLITGNSFSFVATIGLIALIGIEVKNSILLVDYTNQLRAGGMGLVEAIEEAGETRFIPILLTTMTAIGGLMPLVIEGSPLYSPLAWVLIGGLISSLLLTRIVTPVLYKLLAPRIEPAMKAA
ncbi:MAG: efflux RND transporter permease subunit [Ferruginibacter sp.]|nr:efflux RND transporter permease subunit [Cytophagales bacterium]